MRVRCDRIVYPPGGPDERELEAHPRVTIGKEYIVLQMVWGPGKELEIGILDDDGHTGSQWPARMFTTTDVAVPSNFGARIYEDGRVQLAPRSWLRDGFWDEVTGSTGSDRATRLAAADLYKRELEIVVTES